MLELLLMHDCENKRGDKTEVQGVKIGARRKGVRFGLISKCDFEGKRAHKGEPNVRVLVI